MKNMKNKIKTIKPTCQITCAKMNYIKRENEGTIKLSCINCRDKRICIMSDCD